MSFVCFGPRRRGDGARPRRGAVVTMLRAGMGKIPNYFKSAQKELLSLGGKLIDKMKDYDKDNIPTKARSRRPCGAFTLSMGLVAIARCRG